jgi:tetratricopeptide (TPR) repeat protein
VKWAVLAGAVLLAGVIWGQSAAVREASTALARGDFTAAERILRAEALAHPDDAWAASLLGYSLDNLKRGREAGEFHRKAVALEPYSAEILNNYGTHLWMDGDYSQAESVFSDALAASPTYFNVLYNLGVMATNAGHYGRAREVLESARLQQPRNVDVLYRLAAAEELSKHWEEAMTHLAQAARLDPKRADVQKLLAFTATELGALPDAASAWDAYLALAPDDDAARRERGYTSAKTGKLQHGIADLEWYVARHPDDKVGHYELGQAQRSLDGAKALESFERALTLDPGYVAALSARGGLHYQEGRFEAALPDLEKAVALDPRDSATLDRLGQTYQALDRTGDAVSVLRRAAALAPGDSKIVLHLGRALADAGEVEESRAVMDRFRQAGPEKKNVVPEGLVSYLAMTPEERRADYRARVEKAVREHPGDSAAQVEYLKVLLDAGDSASLAAAARAIAALKPAPEVMAEAGHALLAARHFDLARDLLRQAGASGRTDLAVATFDADPSTFNARAGLALLDRIPESQRDGDTELARARMLQAEGNPLDAAAACQRAVQLDPARKEVRLRAAAFLVAHRRAGEALHLLDGPQEREILLMKATTLDLLRRSEEASRIIDLLRGRSPEWPAVWAALGIIDAVHGRWPEAARALEAAVALGARNGEIDYFLAKAHAGGGSAESDAPQLDRFFAGSLVVPR